MYQRVSHYHGPHDKHPAKNSLLEVKITELTVLYKVNKVTKTACTLPERSEEHSGKLEKDEGYFQRWKDVRADPWLGLISQQDR